MPSTITDRVLGVASQAAIKAPCRCATTGNIASLAGLLTVDGVALADGNRVLVWQQSDTTQNGIYAAGTGAWERTTDCNGPRDLVQGTQVLAVEGTVNAGRTFWVTTASPMPGQALAFAALAIPVAPSDDSVTNAKLANMASGLVKGRFSAGAGDPEDGTPDQVFGLIELATAETAPAADDSLGLHDLSADAGRKMTLANVLKVVAGLPELTAVDGAADHLLAVDASDGLAKRVKPTNLPGGGVVPIASFTVGAPVAEVVFTNIPANFLALLVTFSGVSGSAASSDFYLRVSTDNGSSFLSTGYSGVLADITDGLLTTQTVGFELAITVTAASLVTGAAVLFANAGPQARKLLLATNAETFTAQTVAAGAVNALRFFWLSGNLDAGTIELHGLH